MHFKYDIILQGFDLSVNFDHGNPETTRMLADLYSVRPENVFVSGEGASGQNARLIRVLAERNQTKNEAIVEFPTYEPLLRQVQEHFPRVKRFRREEKDDFTVRIDELERLASDKTGLVVLTNPHAPSGNILGKDRLCELMQIAEKHDFYVVCDEIYAEFERDLVPTIFSVNSERGIVTTSFTKASGLGGLKLGVALASQEIVEAVYEDLLNTAGNCPNIVSESANRLLTNGLNQLVAHRRKYDSLKRQTERWLMKNGLKFSPNRSGVTYWVKLPVADTYKWICEHAIPEYSLAMVPGAFFLLEGDCTLPKSNMVRLGLGGIDPDNSNLSEGLETFEKALDSIV